MSLSLYQVSIPPFIHGLRILSQLLKKGQEHAATGSTSEDKLVKARLIDDMGALTYQIQRVSDTAKGLAMRLGGTPNVPMPDTETTFPEMEARIQKTIDVLERVKESDFVGKENAEITMGQRKMTGTAYVLNYALPNYYFHLVTAYGLLRKEGVPVGKSDYLRLSEES